MSNIKNKTFNRTLLMATTVAFTMLSSAATAADADDRIKELEARIKKLEALISDKGDIPSTGKNKAVVTKFSPSPTFESADGNFSFTPTGRLHLDTTFIDDDVNDFADGTNLRRARLGAKGKVGEDWAYKFEIDLGGESTNVADAFIRYSGFEAFDLKVGNFKPAFGLEQNTSSNHITFIERAGPTSVFSRSRLLSAGIFTGNSFASAGWTVSGEDPGNNSGADDEGWSTDARLTVAPIAEKGRVLHLGAGASYRTPNGSATTLQNRVRPTTGFGDRIIDTGNISDVDNTVTFNGELAAVYEGLTLQGEYFYQTVNRENGSQDAEFDGWYASASYLLTGETRPYKASAGKFKRIVPDNPFSLKNGTWGAWEIAARYETTDLTDLGAGVSGGELDAVTFGLTWYARKHIRFLANYSILDSDSTANPNPNDDPNVLNFRAQVDF